MELTAYSNILDKA